MCYSLLLTLGMALSIGDVEPLATEWLPGSLASPVLVTHAPEDYGRLYIVEREGRVRVFDLRDNSLRDDPFLDLGDRIGSTESERGFLGLAFHPEFRSNRRLFVNYTDTRGDTIISEFCALDADTCDATSERVLLSITQPQDWHNGGWIGFGHDGMLFIATGDGGDQSTSQDITDQLLGKILRIDVDGALPYAIPADNPFVGAAGDDEIWAFGLRNPWRCSFDRMTGELYIADVGASNWEELNLCIGSASGLNFGWPCREGMHEYDPKFCAGTHSDPIFEYNHDLGGRATVGGYVYRGCSIPSLDGFFVTTDFVSGGWILRVEDGVVVESSDRTDELVKALSMGQDARGELYLCRWGGVKRVVSTITDALPADLDCSHVVDVADLLIVLSSWGPCDGCLADIDGDREVAVSDLLVVLFEWGESH